MYLLHFVKAVNVFRLNLFIFPRLTGERKAPADFKKMNLNQKKDDV